MTIEEIKKEFEYSDRWEFSYETSAYAVFYEKDEYEADGFGYRSDLFITLWNDGFLSISEESHACYFVSQRIPVELFQTKEHDDGTEIYIDNTSNTYGAEFEHLNLYL